MDKNIIKKHLTETFLSEEKKPVGLTSTEKVQKDSKKSNDDNQKEVAKEMKAYEEPVKAEAEPVKYENDEDQQTYHDEMEIMNGLEMNRFDNKPSKQFQERAEKAIAGDPTMGNSPDYANVVTADQAGFTGPDFGKELVEKIKSSKKKRDAASELSNKNTTSVDATDFKDSAMNNKDPKQTAISESKESSKFSDKINSAGKELTLDTIYNEDKQEFWDDDAQAMIDYYKKNGKTATIIHKGNEHALYVEKSIKENKSNKMKRLVFKKEFKGVENALKLIPESYKVNNKQFQMTDGNEKYEIRWEGSLNEGRAVILKASDKELMNEDMQKMKHLMGYKSQDTLGNMRGAARIDENKKFDDIWNKTKNILNEMGPGMGFSGEGNLDYLDKGNLYLDTPVPEEIDQLEDGRYAITGDGGQTWVFDDLEDAKQQLELMYSGENVFGEGEDFPDLTGDGKVTKADILKGRGVELDESEEV